MLGANFFYKLFKYKKINSREIARYDSDNQNTLENQLNIQIGVKIEVLKKIDFDKSLEIKINKERHHISNDVTKHLLIKKT